MNIHRICAGIILLPASAALLFAAKRDWKQGTVVSMDEVDEHRYEYVVSDAAYFYTVELDRPLKTKVHDAIKFVIEQGQLVLLDADGEERSARIEKRERVLLDPKSERRRLPPR
jgi:hypothetical protein